MPWLELVGNKVEGSSKKKNPFTSQRVFVFGEGEDARGVSYQEAGKSDRAQGWCTRRARHRWLPGTGLPFYSLPHAGTSHHRALCTLSISSSPSVQRIIPFFCLRQQGADINGTVFWHKNQLQVTPIVSWCRRAPFPWLSPKMSIFQGLLCNRARAPFTHCCWETSGRINPTLIPCWSSHITHPSATLCPLNVTWCPLICPQDEFSVENDPSSPSITPMGESPSFRAPHHCRLRVASPALWHCGSSPPPALSWRGAAVGGQGGKQPWGGGYGGVW